MLLSFHIDDGRRFTNILLMHTTMSSQSSLSQLLSDVLDSLRLL